MPEFKKDKDPEKGQPKTYSEEEYKNLQAFSTKANQWLIDTSKKLIEANPKELLNMDSTIQNKIIKDKWGYDNIDELKSFLPEVLWEGEPEIINNDKWGNDIYNSLKREQEMLKYKLNKKEIDDEVDKYMSTHSQLLNSVPQFKEKVIEELKYISSDLTNKERVSRATKLVSGNTDISVEAYLQLQWKNVIKSSKQDITDDYISDAQNKLRASLWLKTK